MLILKTNTENTLRKVKSDDRKKCYGLFGTVEDLVKQKLFDYCAYDPETWAYIDMQYHAEFFDCREHLVEWLKSKRLP